LVAASDRVVENHPIPGNLMIRIPVWAKF
jgi:hypothetical protein